MKEQEHEKKREYEMPIVNIVNDECIDVLTTSGYGDDKAFSDGIELSDDIFGG